MKPQFRVQNPQIARVKTQTIRVNSTLYSTDYTTQSEKAEMERGRCGLNPLSVNHWQADCSYISVTTDLQITLIYHLSDELLYNSQTLM